jgi:uroporphyrin-III C-methyltransferase
MSRVTLIGAGPGDSELLTRKAWRILGEADVVLHDALIDCAGMQSAAPDAKWLDVGKRLGRVSVEQEFICRLLVSYAKKGLNVVRLKGGDPSIFGRMAEEIDACREAGLTVEVVPGVTSACAAAAQIQTSLTLRGISRSVAFVTPRVGKRSVASDSEWLAVSLAAHTIVLYMAGSQSKDIGEQLIVGGKSPDLPVCVIENASLSGVCLRMSLRELANNSLPTLTGPVLIMLGEAFSTANSKFIQDVKNASNTQFAEAATG